MNPSTAIKSNTDFPDRGIPIFLLTDEQGLIYGASESLQLFTGKGRQELIGHSIASFLTEAETNKFKSFIVNAAQNESDFCSIVLKGRRQDDKISFFVKRRKPGSNLFDWTCIAGSDFRQLLKGYDEMPWFIQFFERSAEPVFIYNAIDLSMTFVNEAALNLYGYAGKDLLNGFLYDEEAILHAATPDHPYILQPGNYSLFSKLGKQVSVQAFTSPVDIHGITHCLVFGTHVQIIDKETMPLLHPNGKLPTIHHTPGELDMIVASMDDVVFEYDHEGLFRKVWCRNETVLLMIPEQFLGKSMQEAFRALPDFVAPFIDDFETALSRKEICIRDFSLRTGNNTRWFKSKISPLYHSSGSPKGFTQRITDITEQKLVELAIEEKNVELKATHTELGEIIEHASDIIFKLDLEGKILFVSPEITRSLGYKVDPLKGKYFGKLVHTEDLPLCENILKALRQHGHEEKALVCRLQRTDGSMQWFSISAVYIFDDKKQPQYCIGFAKNVNELQQLVESLRATEERYTAFINHSSEGIWRFEYGDPLPVTISTDEMITVFMTQGYLAECNDQMAKFYGYDKATEITGTHLREFLPPDDPRNIEYLRAFIDNGYQLLNAESFETDKHGNKKYFLNNLIGIVRDGLLLRVWGTQRDITEQRIAEDQIRFLARVVKDVSDVIISTDLDFRVFAWNKAAETVYGIPEKDAIGKPIRMLVEHHYINCTREEAIQHLNKNETWEGEVYFDRNDGKRIFISMTLSYVKNEKGQRIGFAGIHRDITSRKESEDALRISEQRYRSLVDALGEGIFLIDRNEKILASNSSAEKIMGMSKEQLTGLEIHNGYELLQHEDGSFFKKEEQPSYITLKTGKPVQNVIMGLTRNDGSLCWISVNTEPIYYSPGETPDAIVASIVDITEKKKAELALLRSEQQLRDYSERIGSILDSITDGFLAVDNDLNVVMWNHILEKATGKKSSEVIGKNITGIYPELLEKKVYQKYFDSLKENTPVTFESFSERLNIWFESSAYPSRQGLFIYFRDITERKTQENLLSLEKDVLEINSQPAASLRNTVDYFLEGLERIFPGMLCSVLAVDGEEKKIRHLSAPSLPITFATAVDGLAIGPRAGSCGTAMFLRQRVISSNIEEDPLWDSMRDIFLQFGIKSSWAFPIMNAHGEVIATVSAYYKYPKAPDEKALNVLERITNLLRIIIVNKKAEELIRLSNERFQLISRAANDAIWDWDISGKRLYWGEGFYTLFNHQPGYLENSIHFWEDQIHEEDRERVLKSIREFLDTKTGSVWSDEYRFRKADGNFVLVLDRGFLIYSQDGTINRMVGSMQDITEKREMERQLLKQQLGRQQIIAQAVVDAQEKERADIGKELHDNVNQILSTARLFLDLARTDENERFNLIKRSTQNISDAINEIRNISRSLVPGSIGDLGIIESINDLMETVKATRKLHVEFYHEGEADKLLDDKQKLMLFRIIQEQVNNVLKHAEARNLVIELVVYDEGIDLTISDNGIGFELDKVKNKKGVGLYNISSRAELFNGKVNIVTSPGNGCKMNIHVPIINL